MDSNRAGVNGVPGALQSREAACSAEQANPPAPTRKKHAKACFFSLIFACGEYNCFAVIFRCRRVKLRCAQFGRRISFHFSRQRNSSRLPQDKHFIPRVSGIIHSIPQELGFIFLLVMGFQVRIPEDGERIAIKLT